MVSVLSVATIFQSVNVATPERYGSFERLWTQNYDVNKQATRQEMRSYVCGQCHDEYHFSGPEKRLVYPWAKGLLVENILAFYDEQKFKDWEHADTGAPILKAQHPEFEMWNQGIHARILR